MIEVCLLGNSGYMPLPNRWLSSLLIRYHGKMFLFDCGEGTQIPFKMAGWGMKALDVICISHFHCDHVAGIPGLLLSIGNSGRTEPLTIVGPRGINAIMSGLLVIAPQLPYSLEIMELSTHEQSILHLDGLDLKSLPAQHSVPCLSYSLELSRLGQFNAEKAKELGVPVAFWKKLQNGAAYKSENRTITPEMVLGQDRKGIKVCFCTDTRPTDNMPDFFKKADLLVCEGMYGDENMHSKAISNQHMTFSEAAHLAFLSEVGELWLTHFSPSMENPRDFIHIATNIFANTELGQTLFKKTFHF